MPMKLLLFTPLLSLGLAAIASAAPVHLTQYAGGFTAESATDDDTQIVKEGGATANTGGVVAAIKNDSWVRYNDFAFMDGASHFTIEAAAAPGAGGTIELRTGWDPNRGNLIGQVAINSTGGTDNYQTFTCPIAPCMECKQNLILKFVGAGTGDLFKIRNFRFTHNGSVHATGTFTSSSEGPNSQDGHRLERISDGSWISYQGYTFPAGTNQLQIEAATPNSGGSIELRNGSPTGPLIATAPVTQTGDWGAYRLFVAPLQNIPTGPIDLHMRFVRAVGSNEQFIFNTRYFRMANSAAPTLRIKDNAIAASSFNSKVDAPSAPLSTSGFQVSGIRSGASVTYTGVNFGSGSDRFQVELASPGKAGKIEIRLGPAPGRLVATINGSYTGSSTLFRAYTTKLNWLVCGTKTVTLKFVGYDAEAADLMNVRSFAFWKETPVAAPVTKNLSVYDPVPGLAESPYYDIYVQKASAFGSTLPENAPDCSWMKPFDWFTQCADYPNVGNDTDNGNAHKATFNSAYYSQFIGGWSHTYSNFEMDPNTPIVVKIVRKNPTDGAPGGNITSATAHPAHKLTAAPQVIGGAVYLRLKNPALVAVDIDGQLDGRDTPRAQLGWSGDAATFPHRTKQAGAHSLTIFANPYIKDKPAASGDTTVHYVHPGDAVPRTGIWKTLYFLPGIHNLSMNPDGSERPWQPTDAFVPESDKSYYIPGDAIVYGNFNDNGTHSGTRDKNGILVGGVDEKNVRIFGHGTISGQKIPHWQDINPTDFDASFRQAGRNGRDVLHEDYHKTLRMLQVSRAEGCSFEGVTVANPAEHGIYIEGGDDEYTPNKISWVKNISWRVNNDGGGVSGNGTVEDCFFRHQDDALYVRGSALRRCVLWSDVNGTPLRTSFIHHDRYTGYPSAVPQDTVVEDIDVIYCRGVFAGNDATAFGVIGSPGGYDGVRSYGEGTPCTGQHVVFRRITVSDPKPGRYLFGFDFDGDINSGDNQKTPWAGLRFHNVVQLHKHTWGWRNRLMGGSSASGGLDAAKLEHWTFDRVKINYGMGLDALDLADVNDATKFEIRNTNDLIFR